MNNPSRSGRRSGNANGQEALGLARGVVGSARVIAFGASNVAPAGAVVGGLVIVVSYAGFASPLVVIIAFVASLCCASSIAEFARRYVLAELVWPGGATPFLNINTPAELSAAAHRLKAHRLKKSRRGPVPRRSRR